VKFINIKMPTEKVSFLEAVERGVGTHGGLFIPESFPQFSLTNFEATEFQSIATNVLRPFLSDDFSDAEISKITEQSFDFPIPLKKLNDHLSLLELFHGPTAAFKDVAAQFIATVMEHSTQKPKTILVATSGDTGGAVASAFYRRAGFRVIILFPQNGVSELQKKQLTCWGENIVSLAVQGSFDQCQSIVKELLSNKDLVAKYSFTSANSINVARLLPQACYYAASSIWWWKEKQRKANYFIPTGNMGNALGAVWARLMGFPIDKITMTTNANKVIPDYFSTGNFKPLPSLSTLANAMDVGNPSNFARLHYQFPKLEMLQLFCRSVSISDATIKSTIIKTYQEFAEIICPHTATAFSVALQEKAEGIVVSTAHPAKFKEIVEPLIGNQIELPKNFHDWSQKKSQFHSVEPSITAVSTMIQAQFK